MASIANRQSLLVARDELELVGGCQNPSYATVFCPSAQILNGNGHHNFHQNFLHPANQHRPNTMMMAESSSAADANGDGPLSTLRRSLRQMNPFKSRLFRLPATPRLSRSKKVLGRGEDFTGWNFERPGQNHNNNGSTQSSATNSLRPLSSSSFGPVDFDPGNSMDQNAGQHCFFQRRFSNVDGGVGYVPPSIQFQPSPIFQRRPIIGGPNHSSTNNAGCNCCNDQNNGLMMEEEGIGDLDEFLDAMESISKRGQIGGSCRIMTAREEMHWNGRCQQEKGGTVAGAEPLPLMESGTKRTRRPPIPSFNPPPPSSSAGCWPPSPSTAFPSTNRQMLNGHQNQTRKESREESPYLKLLPSTCYSPNGEMYAARWRPGQSMMANKSNNNQFNGESPQLSQRGRQRPQPFYIGGGQQLLQAQQNEPKSPSQSSTITLLNTQMMASGGVGMRSASTVSSASAGGQRHQQKQMQAIRPKLFGTSPIGLFPQTQLQRRRSACSASAALETMGNGRHTARGDGSIAEDEEGEERAQQQANGQNYYGQDVLKLMGLEKGKGQSSESAQNSPSLLPIPHLLFPMEDELFIGTAEDWGGGTSSLAQEFVGREWLFKELFQQLVIEKAKLVILMGQPGSGKSAIVRQLVANSHFCAHQKIDSSPQQSADQQHNTVDSGIAISAGGSGGGNSSGSQLSLLNVSYGHNHSGHTFGDPIASTSGLSIHQHRCPSPTPSSSNGRNYEWLRALGQHICAFHFSHLHDANSCAVPEFIRSICAQFCRCPQLKHTYGKIIRSNENLHRLASQDLTALSLAPLELFRQLILQPICQIYEEDEERKRKGPAKRCSSKGSDYGSSNFGSSDRNPFPSSHNALHHSPLLPNAIIVLVDGLDEAGFHRTDGGESIGWLLHRSLPEWPSPLRFMATLTLAGPGALSEQNSIFGTLSEGEKPLEARTIRLDDWELDERIGRDARLFVEAKVHQTPALEKWVSGQFRRQSFFASSPSPLSFHQYAHQANLGEFAVQLVQHCRANYSILQLCLTMLAEGRALSLGTLPVDIGQLYVLHFRHKFHCSSRFEPFSQIFSILFASLYPLNFDQLLIVLNAAEGEKGRRIGDDELRQRLAQLSPLIIELPTTGRLIPFHPTLREWILKEAGSTEFAIDIRQGHILLAYSLLCANPPNNHNNQFFFFELAHHLLKANPHKYIRPELTAKLGMPQGRDAQIQWLRIGAERAMCQILNALLTQRNVFYPNSKVSRLLLLAGADPNAKIKWPNGKDESLLCAFSRAGNAEMVQLLLQFGANPNLGCPSPLILAIKNVHEPIVRLLCANGADLMVAKDIEGKGPLWHSAATDSLDMLSFLLDTFGDVDGIKPKKKDKFEENNENWNGVNHTTHFRQYSSASTTGYEEEIVPKNEQQLRKETNLAQNRLDRNEAIREAFECAAEKGVVRVCRFLLDCTDAVLDTSRAMCIACANGRSEIVQFLLSRGATLTPDQMWNDKSALICAVESGSWDLVVNVLNGAAAQNGGMAELNATRGPDRLSPLMVAARHGHVGLVDLLVNRGAHLDATDAHGRTAAMHAIEAGHTSTVGLLLERGCAIHARDAHSNTMLHLLGRHPRKCLINRLLEAGLSLEDKNREELRPIEVAIECGQLTAVDAFLRRGARLRTLTWQIALATHPPLILVLLRKLLDDAQILLRRKRAVEAMHRLKYAQQKCDEMLAMTEDGANPKEALRAIRPQLRKYKVQSLLSMASLKRKANNLFEAISLASQALEMLDTDNKGKMAKVKIEDEGGTNWPLTPNGSSSSNSEGDEGVGSKEEEEEEKEGQFRFELHLLRAKCHFDARDLAKARADAKLAADLRPSDQEAKSLLAILGTGWSQIG